MLKKKFNEYQTAKPANDSTSGIMRCSHEDVKKLLLQQWKELPERAIGETGYHKQKLALLIEKFYGIHHRLGENYLSNLERTLPLPA